MTATTDWIEHALLLPRINVATTVLGREGGVIGESKLGIYVVD